MRRFPIRGLFAAALVVLPGPVRADPVVVFAAASLKTALDAVAAAWTSRTGTETAIAYAGSPALARQIEAGAPADVFVSADLAWMDYLGARGLIAPETRIDLLGNRLALIAADPGAPPVEIAPGLDLAGLLDGGRLAMADVEAVPAGRYGKAALEHLDLWSGVEDRLAQTENVRAALAFVALGEAPYGVVYATDATAEEKVRVVGIFPDDSHPPIVYPAALTAVAAGPDPAAFLAFLRGPEARTHFEAQGFKVSDAVDAPGK